MKQLKSRKISLVLGLLSVLIGAPTSIRADNSATGRVGFTTSELEVAGRQALVGASQQLQVARVLYAQTETLRLGLVLNPDAIRGSLSSSEQGTLSAALGPNSDILQARLAWFARSASVRVGPSESPDTTGLYNSLADMWLVLRWAKVGGVWRVVGAKLSDGKALRPFDEAPSWTNHPSDYASAIGASR
jgi:hypothetical protein